MALTYSRTEDSFNTAGRSGGSFGPSGTSTLPCGSGVAVDIVVPVEAVGVPVSVPTQPAVARPRARRTTAAVRERSISMGAEPIGKGLLQTTVAVAVSNR
jgi:hypothetical protein